jgi:hypothetical protein
MMSFQLAGSEAMALAGIGKLQVTSQTAAASSATVGGDGSESTGANEGWPPWQRNESEHC